MSLKDDLARNRRIFELLTEPESTTENTAAQQRQRAFSPPDAEPENNTKAAKPFDTVPQDAAQQKIEAFSLGFGSRVSRETGMSLSFSPPEGIDFPKLAEAAAPSPADPLEKLYRQLEAEARRSSQLLSEEEY